MNGERYATNRAKVEDWYWKYTKQGILKYQTDCAPHNGYYLIPLYDKGEYILKVEPPTGWSFEPNSVELQVDGKTDLCSLQKDINFIFKGFLLSGKVVSGKLKDGPSFVTVSLESTNKNIKDRLTKTEEGGIYSFDAVQPGEYTVKVKHDRWTFAKDNYKIKVTSDFVRVPENFVVTGYDVSGRVISDEDSIRGVNFILFSKSIKWKELSSSSCNPTLPAGFSTVPVDKEEKLSALCHVTSDSNGAFKFKTLPPGEYRIQPFYKGQHTKFDVRPSSMALKIEHEDVVLSQVFQVIRNGNWNGINAMQINAMQINAKVDNHAVQGFSVSGKVLSTKYGKGIVKANVIVTSESDPNIQTITTQTYDGGVYHLENMKVGMYKIAVQYPSGDLIFSPISLKITPNTPQLPDIIAHGFKVCGKLVLSTTKMKTDDVVLSVSVEQVGVPGSTNILTVDKHGEFCSVVKAGKYSVKPIVSVDSVGQPVRLRFKPTEAIIDVSDKAKLDIVFTQFLSSISGNIRCIAQKCNDGLTVLMEGVDSDVSESTVVNSNGKFTFEKLLSGSYKLTVTYDAWCWKDNSVNIQIGNKDMNHVEFIQTGYLMTLWTSHKAKITYKLAKQQSTLQNFDLVRGTNSICLNEAGRYDLSVISCHEFGEEKYVFDTSNPAVITFTAMKHQVVGKILTDVASDDIKVNVLHADATSSIHSC
ncbi:Nodal modulator 1 [Nymphon striatum]|nr:Nodal modulator 1 [Nymphon striatum]